MVSSAAAQECAPCEHDRVKCLRCNAPVDLARPTCASCGHPLDADGDGMPDAIGKLVEDKVREAVAAERERAASAARETDRVAKAEAASAEIAKQRALLKTARERLAAMRRAIEETHAEPRRIAILSRALAVLVLVLTIPVAGCTAGCVEPLVGRPLVAGRVFCPGHCDGCRGPGRIFEWSESTNGDSPENVATQLCHNPSFDLEAITWMDVSNLDDPNKKPYRLTLWANFLVDLPIVFAVLLAIAPFVAGWMQRRGLVNRGRGLTREAAAAETEIAQLEARLGKPVETGEAYR
jgi:hypothetical protein